jgi:mono/diheme cytochrome c family protein
MKFQRNIVLGGTVATGIAAAAMSLGSGLSSAAVPTPPDAQALYGANCASCHKADGTGLGTVFPPLAGNKDVTSKNPGAILTVVRYGKNAMPGYGGPQAAHGLTNLEVAVVMTYIRASWGNKASPVTEKQVASAPTPAPK